MEGTGAETNFAEETEIEAEGGSARVWGGGWRCGALLIGSSFLGRCRWEDLD